MFSFWLEDLEKEDWISVVETLNYDYVNRKSSIFFLKIGKDEDSRLMAPSHYRSLII